MIFRELVGGVAFAAAILRICSAEAADLQPAPAPAPAPSPPVSYAPPPFNWSGFYLGGHIGGAYAGSTWSDPINGSTNDVFNSPAGFLGGGQFGVNAQFNRLVLGVEGDFSWLGLNGSGNDSMGDTINTTTQWTSTVTGRVGAAFDRLLFYGKGGLALAQDESTLTDLSANASSTTLMRTGWTVGAGLEYGLTQNWSVRLEYDYLNFGSQPLSFTTPVLGTVTSNASLNDQEIKAGINFRFGGP